MEEHERPTAETPPRLPASTPPTLQPVAARAPRRSAIWIIASVVLALLLAGSLLLNVGQLFRGIGGAAPTFAAKRHWLEPAILEDNDSRHNIVVVDLMGIITSDAWDRSGYNLVEYIQDQLRQAGESRSVAAVVLRIDSPGGEVLASDDIYRAIREFQKDYDKPVIASMGSLAASGGYYTAVGSRWIVANELTLTGSIGVIMRSYNYRALMNKVGVRPLVFKSGPFKDMLSGDKLEEEVLPEERRMLQDIIDQMFGRFKEVVRDGRTAAHEANAADDDGGQPLTSNWEQYADGRILTGRQAYEMGFADELGTFETAVRRAKSLADIPDANLIQYQRRFDLGDLFRLFGQTEDRRVTLDFGLDLPRLDAGRAYYLSPAYVH
jgi:protease IV